MSYAGSLTAGLLRAATLGRTGFLEGKQEGGAAVAKAKAAQIKDAREAVLAAAQAASANRTAGLVDPNSAEVLSGKNAAALKLHATNRLFDAAHPVSGEGTTGDKASQRARSAYKARLMTPVPSKYPGGTAKPGMSEAEAEALVTEAWGPSTGGSTTTDTSTRSLMGGSILRGGGAARGSATSTPAPRATSSAPANAAGLNTTGGKKTGGIDLSNSSAQSTGANLKERDMSPADLWDKKVGEGMNPEQATAYVHRMKGSG